MLSCFFWKLLDMTRAIHLSCCSYDAVNEMGILIGI